MEVKANAKPILSSLVPGHIIIRKRFSFNLIKISHNFTNIFCVESAIGDEVLIFSLKGLEKV